jgi:transcription-repair coupling factor (superfamily II helicase)
MDRLVCGDVGFGKTEVALRAAAAVALAGKQVAIVAPTTVLVRQHVRSFQRRFAGLGIKVEHLSRLVKPAEANAVKKGLADGSIRIVIGTHALAAKGVAFKDLGLVVIDEEQRFGAAHKARLRGLAFGGHVLTLTATPIPRTMQAALVGLQELSIIATPPARRQPIRTFLTPFDPATVREALMRERRRRGQSFVVCSRVEDIEPARELLAKLVPELALLVAHGQMPAADADDVMVRFADGDGDVLLATNIIESGLDVPRANTMLVWRADRFGLSQLHQLRGRVGRGRVRGTTYLLTEPGKELPKATEKRLRALEALDRLGAGFAISAQDLDQRGAGAILGEEQTGHVKMVGADLYQHMLKRALRGEPLDDDWTPDLNLGLTGMIPEAYVNEPEMRINLYARLARLDSSETTDDLEAEIEDRFGPMPEPVRHLLGLTELKQACRRAGVARVDAGPQAIALTFRPEAVERLPVQQLIEASDGTLRWSGERLILAVSEEDAEKRRERVGELLDRLQS